MKFVKTAAVVLALSVLLTGCSGKKAEASLHIHHDNDVYGSEEYLESTVLIAGSSVPQEKSFTLAEMEKLSAENESYRYSGYYSQMSSGGEFHYHYFCGLKLYEFLKYCGVSDSCPDDTPVKFYSVDGFSHEIPWGDIKNSTDNTYSQKGDTLPKYKNVPKILAFSSDGIPLVGPVGNIELGHVYTEEEGYSETAENFGGPVRLVFGQKEPNTSNAPRNIQWVRQIIVGQDDHEAEHTQMLEKEQELRSNDLTVVDDMQGTWNHFSEPYSAYLSDELKVYGSGTKAEKIYTLSEIENRADITVTDSFGASLGVNAYKGIRLWDIVNENLKAEIDRPSRIFVLSSDGYETELNVDDVLNGVESKYQAGQNRDVIIAYAKNGEPLLYGENASGFEGDNGTGPMQLIVENQISKWVEHVAAIRIESD